jgi:hypothetical protein
MYRYIAYSLQVFFSKGKHIYIHFNEEKKQIARKHTHGISLPLLQYSLMIAHSMTPFHDVIP